MRSYTSKPLYLLGTTVLFVTLTSCSIFENEQDLAVCNKVFVVAEQMPDLKGSMANLQGKIEYPKEAKESGVEGRVTVQFVVDKFGDVRDAKVIRGIGAGADEEALRVVKTATFDPGEQDGEPVCVQYALSVNFRLEN